MKNRRFGSTKGLLGAVGLVMALVAPVAWGQTVNIGAVPTIEIALETDLNNLIKQFKAANPDYDEVDFEITYNPSGTLAEAIAAALDADPPLPSPYDLFLAADTAGPAALNTSFPSEVGTPLDYAHGTLMLWSNGNIDVTQSPASFAANFDTTGICNPNMGPYGAAAILVLQGVYDIDTSNTTKVPRYMNIDLVDSNTLNGVVQSGWVPTALHCSDGAVYFPTPSQDPDYSANLTYQTFAPGTAGYDATQAGVTVTTSSTSADTAAAAQALLDWLAGTDGQAAIHPFCL
jgi:molybdate transport system substrate-binding protein